MTRLVIFFKLIQHVYFLLVCLSIDLIIIILVIFVAHVVGVAIFFFLVVVM
jgi:hypothetical protein